MKTNLTMRKYLKTYVVKTLLETIFIIYKKYLYALFFKKKLSSFHSRRLQNTIQKLHTTLSDYTMSICYVVIDQVNFGKT